MKSNQFKAIILVVSILTIIGTVAGYFTGQWLLSGSTLTQTKDLINAYVYAPLIGGAIGFAIGAAIMSKK